MLLLFLPAIFCKLRYIKIAQHLYMDSMKKRFVVIGASAASIAFITKLRSFDKESEITCLSGESYIPYNRCLLADYISDDISFGDMVLKTEDFFKQQNILLRLNTWVTQIDTKNNCVCIGDENIVYDYLFLGVGTRPFIPNIGAEDVKEGLFTFHTADDAKKLSHYIDQQKPSNVIVVGGGINGIECVSSLHSRHQAVGLIERSPQILPTQADQQVVHHLTRMMQQKSIALFMGQEVEKICTKQGKVTSVLLKSGSHLMTECVVLATGSTVNSDLLQDTGIATSHGSIVVDQCLKTNIDNVYAGGDVCTVQDMVTKKTVKSATWADAMLQGLCAATQFSQKPRLYPGYVGLRDSKFFEQDFYACGQTVDHDSDVESVILKQDSILHAFYIKENCLIGFVLLGDISKLADYKKIYLTQQSVTKKDFVLPTQ